MTMMTRFCLRDSRILLGCRRFDSGPFLASRTGSSGKSKPWDACYHMVPDNTEWSHSLKWCFAEVVIVGFMGNNYWFESTLSLTQINVPSYWTYLGFFHDLVIKAQLCNFGNRLDADEVESLSKRKLFFFLCRRIVIFTLCLGTWISSLGAPIVLLLWLSSANYTVSTRRCRRTLEDLNSRLKEQSWSVLNILKDF